MTAARGNNLLKCLTLFVILEVPVGVEHDDGVGSSESDAQPASACGEQEHEDVRAGPAEPVYGLLSVTHRHRPVYALQLVLCMRDREHLDEALNSQFDNSKLRFSR